MGTSGISSAETFGMLASTANVEQRDERETRGERWRETEDARVLRTQNVKSMSWTARVRRVLVGSGSMYNYVYRLSSHVVGTRVNQAQPELGSFYHLDYHI